MAVTTDSTGRVLGNRYRLLTPLGTGASAHVFLAEDLMLQRQVAVKVLLPGLAHDDAFLKRFHAEARAAGSLNHPHVMRVFDWGQDADGPYLVLEYLGGGSLLDILSRGTGLEPSQAVQVGIQAAQGLAYAHAHGIVHRDIKPANLLFDDEGRLRVADFGVARALAVSTWTEPEGAVIGTARYASPEQAQGQPLDGGSDVYALSLVLYEAVAGVVPFAADTAIGTLMARIGKRLPPHPALGQLQEVLVWAANPDPAARPGASAFERQLMAAASHLPPPTPLRLARHDGRGDLPPTGGVPGSPMPAGDLTGAVPVVGRLPGAAAAGGLAGELGADSLGAPDLGAGGVTSARADLTGMAPATGQVPASARPSARPSATVSYQAPSSHTAVHPVVRPPLAPAPQAEEAVAPQQARRRRRRWPWLVLLLVLALAAGGVYAWRTKVFTPSHPVPNLAGLTVDQAQRTLAADHFTVGVSSRQYSTTVSSGQIILQRPTTSTSLKEGSVVRVVVSKGLPPESVPSLSGLDCTAAQRILVVANLSGTCPAAAEQYNNTVPSGQVITWSYGGKDRPTQAPWHSTVTIVISKGPQPVAVPSVEGRSYGEAVSALSSVGLKANEKEVTSTAVPSGEAVGTDPASGQDAPYGSAVTVLMSTGPPTTTVPNDMVGMTLTQAQSTLSAAQLKLGTVKGPRTGVVESVSPSGGATVDQGSSVSLVMRSTTSSSGSKSPSSDYLGGSGALGFGGTTTTTSGAAGHR